MLKKIICVVSAVVLMTQGVVMAQDKMPAIEFTPYFFAQIQAGAGSVIPEYANYVDIVTPVTAINVGYFINPSIGVRMSVNYGRGKSVVPKEINPVAAGAVYGYRMLGAYADGILNFNNAFAGYKRRAVDLSMYLGAGVIEGLENFNAGYGSTNLHVELPDRWAAGQMFIAGRAGLILGVNITPEAQLTFDGGLTVSKDRLDSRIDGRPWMQATGKIGLQYNFNPFVHERQVLIRKEANKFSFVLLNLNLVDLANRLTLNIGADVGISKHMTMGFVGKYCPTKDSEDSDSKKMVYLTAKYYPWNIFSGLHFDVMGGISKYAQKNPDNAVERGDKIGAGLGVGYTYVINKSLNLEASAGAWIGQKNYTNYTGNTDGKVLPTSGKSFVEPYEIRIGLSWVINPDSRPGRKEDIGK